MALESVVDSLDGVTEAARKFYTEKDGKFQLDPALDGEIGALKSALVRTTGDNKTIAQQLREAAANLKRFDGIDPDKTRSILSKFDSEEEAQLIAAGKFDDVLERRNARFKQESQRQVEAAQNEAKAAQTRASKFQSRVLDDGFRAAASKIDGLHATAVDDVLLNLRGIFTLDDNGNAVQLDSAGEVVIGKDGKTPYSPAEFLENAKESKPHWFKVSSSGSPPSGNASSGGGKTLKRAQFDSLDPVTQHAKIREGFTVVD